MLWHMDGTRPVLGVGGLPDLLFGNNIHNNLISETKSQFYCIGTYDDGVIRPF